MNTGGAQQMEQVGGTIDPPPVGEELHVPGGSVLPLVVAIGITLIVIGLTVWWAWSILGAIIFVVAVVLWVRDVRHDFDALPEQHHH
ncbi:MAG: hypothetical protein ACRDKL_07760 [Solirubrobacteraceae bacterium]